MGDPSSTVVRDEARDDRAPELWRGARRDPALEAAYVLELSAQGVPIAHGALEVPRGYAASVEPTQGDPQLVAVMVEGEAEPFWVDRRTMRVQRAPDETSAREDDIVQAADLADRAQLVLGEPVLVRFGQSGGRFAIEAVRRLDVRILFTNASYRRLSPLASDDGTLAPLSVDAIERALRLEGDRGEEPRVRRIFARAYRRMDEHHTPWARESREALRALNRMTRLGRDVALCLADARTFRTALTESVARHDAVELTRLDTQDLLDTLRERMGLVTSALALLERGRLSTLSLLPGLEALCGSLPRDVIDVLAAPKRSAERKAVDAKLVELAKRCADDSGTLLLPPRHDAELTAEWARLKRTLRRVRVLGMDVRPDAMGSDDAHLAQAVQEAWSTERNAPDSNRRGAELKLLSAAAQGPVGPLAAAPTAALVALLRRLALAKGSVSEGLSASLLRLRAAALEAGRRLANDGVLERADDTLFMPLDEIEQALEGELGAYAARVRLRREDDRRWRNFAAPRVLSGRRTA